MTVFAAELQALPLVVFALVLAITLGITYWASKRTSTASEFWAAGRGISGFQNGWAVAGDSPRSIGREAARQWDRGPQIR